MLWSFVSLILAVWLLAAIALVLHYVSSRYGVSLLLMYTAAIVGILTYATPVTVFVEPLPGIVLTLPSDVFIPTVILIILVLYAVNGTGVAQIVIFGVALIQLLVAAVFVIVAFQANTSGTVTVSGQPAFTDVLRVNYQMMMAGVIAFVANMFVVAIVYQGTKNLLGWRWLAAGIALLGALWTDAIIFNGLAAFGQGGFVRLLPGDIVSKTLTALALFPLAAIYLTWLAPHLGPNQDKTPRTTFDIFNNIFGSLRLKVQHLEAELDESVLSTNELIRNMNNVFWLADQGNDFAYFVSPALESILGITRGEYYLDPEQVNVLVHPEDEAMAQGRWMVFAETAHDIEFRVIRPDGATRWLRDRTYLVQKPDLQIDRVVGITEDITAQKEWRQLQTAIVIEQEKNTFLHDLIREVSHDIQSPIGAIGLKVDLLERTKHDTERQKKYLKELRQQTRQFSRMVDHLFTLMKMGSRMDNMKDVIDLNLLCEDICNELAPIAEEQGVILECKPGEGSPLVRCSTNDLRRAITNLVSNAIRYTPAGGEGTLTTQLTAAHQVEVRVQDTGIGISADDLPHIFERFFRATNTGDIQGTGLGLAITEQIIRWHAGTISIESTPGEGSTFRVLLPLASKQESPL